MSGHGVAGTRPSPDARALVVGFFHGCSVLKLWSRCLLFSPLSQMYHHFTCATDTGNVSTVFNACKEIILQDNLKGSGFMD